MRDIKNVHILWSIGLLCCLLMLTATPAHSTASEPMTIIIQPGPPPSGNVTVSINDASVSEDAGILTFKITLSGTADKDVNVTYATRDATATAGQDYAASSGLITILSGETEVTLDIPIIDDALAEADETLIVTLQNPVNAEIDDGEGIGTIMNNDDLPTMTISDATAEEEAQKLTFRLTLSGASAQEVTVEYATQDGSAATGQDYAAKSGALTFAPGQQSGVIDVTIWVDENTDEGDETFTIVLGNPTNATLADGQGTGTIQNTHISFAGLRQAMGFAVPEPSTIGLFILGLIGLGIAARSRFRK